MVSILHGSLSLQDLYPYQDLRVCSSFRQNEPGQDVTVANRQADHGARLKTHVRVDTKSSVPTVPLWRSSPAAPHIGRVGMASNGCTGGEEELRKGAGRI